MLVCHGYEAVRELLHDPKMGHDDERLFRRPGMTADLVDRMRNRMAEGEHVFFCIGAANHDPARFTEPDVLDLRRPDNAPLSFGWGVHHCLGAPLARLEAQVTFAQLRERFAPIEVLDLDPDRVAGIVRRPKALPVRIKLV